MKILSPHTLLVAGALLPSAAPFVEAARISGSDIVGPIVAAEVKGQVASAGGRLDTDFRGTYDALLDLRTGKSSAALMYLRDEREVPEIKSGDWVAVPIAYQPVYVVVHRANKATEIDLATLAGLYGKSNDTRFDTWRCLPESGLSQGPLALAPHPGKGLAVSLFRAEVLGGADLKDSVRFAANDAEVESRAASTVNAIVLLSRPPRSGNMKVLSVADGRPGKPRQAYAPTASNLNTGDYPLRITLFAVSRKADLVEARPALRAMLSENVSNLLSENGLHASPENIRKKFSQMLDEAK